MFKWAICVLLAALNFAFALEKSDHAEIDKVISEYPYAWNECGGKGFGDGFTQDADFVNISKDVSQRLQNGDFKNRSS
jgi:hypothetical protein